MESVTITALPSFREGIEFRFRGQLNDDNGEPVSEWVDQVLIVPPLNLSSLRLLQRKLGALNAGGDLESMATIAEAMQHALRRNYSGVPLWLIEQSLDLANMPEFTLAFMDVGGMKRKEVEAGKAAAAAAQTGTASTPT